MTDSQYIQEIKSMLDFLYENSSDVTPKFEMIALDTIYHSFDLNDIRQFLDGMDFKYTPNNDSILPTAIFIVTKQIEVEIVLNDY